MRGAGPGVESVDLAINSVRELNQRLHDLEEGGSQWRVANPNGAHAIAVLPGAEDAELWEPEPGRVNAWQRALVA